MATAAHSKAYRRRLKEAQKPSRDDTFSVTLFQELQCLREEVSSLRDALWILNGSLRRKGFSLHPLPKEEITLLNPERSRDERSRAAALEQLLKEVEERKTNGHDLS